MYNKINMKHGCIVSFSVEAMFKKSFEHMQSLQNLVSGPSVCSQKNQKSSAAIQDLTYDFTLFRPMAFSIKLHTIMTEWSIIYSEWSQILGSRQYSISFSGDQFCLSKQCIPLWNTTFHLGLHCLS